LELIAGSEFLIGICLGSIAKRAHGAQIDWSVSATSGVVDGGSCCSALLTFIPFSFEDFESDLVRNEGIAARVSAAEDIPELLPKGGLFVRV
jgi:hypothetical protein